MTATTPSDSAIHQVGTTDGWHGVISENGPFKPAAGRYHLYIGLFCPFAHRVNLVRHLRGLTDILSVSIVKPYPKGDANGWPGWRFPQSDDEYENATVDHLYGSTFLHEIYYKADPNYKGRYSVPVLWDKETETIVNNESAEILRWLPTAFDSILPPDPGFNLYPKALEPQIDELSPWLQSDLNAGVYKTGFADSQDSYDRAVPVVFRALNKLEALISQNGGPFILGQQLTELDLRTYATIIRFDSIYVQHFKCNLGIIRHDYPVIHNWLKNLYWDVRGFRESTDFRHIKENYTKSHGDINPKAITPMGPIPNVESGVEEDWSRLRIGHIDV